MEKQRQKNQKHIEQEVPPLPNQDTIFQGFVPPVDDYFRMPNEWINICAGINSLAELKIVQYVLRHTWGYQDYDGVRKLTLDEFMHGRKRRDGTRIDKGTGLSDRGVKDGIALAIEHGYLICEIDDRDRARIKKSYGIKMISELTDRKILPPKQKSDRKNSPIPDGKNLPTGRKNSPINKEESSYRSEKDTIERHYRKTGEKDSASLQNSTVSPIEDFSPPSSPSDFSSSRSDPPEQETARKKEDPVPIEKPSTLPEMYQIYNDVAHDLRIATSDYNFLSPDHDQAMSSLMRQGATRSKLHQVMKHLLADPDTYFRSNMRPKLVADNYGTRLGLLSSLPRRRMDDTLERLREEQSRWAKEDTPENRQANVELYRQLRRKGTYGENTTTKC